MHHHHHLKLSNFLVGFSKVTTTLSLYWFPPTTYFRLSTLNLGLQKHHHLCGDMFLVMAGFGPSIKPILRDTFIELCVEVVNKLRDINISKIVIDDIIDDIPESDENIIED